MNVTHITGPYTDALAQKSEKRQAPNVLSWSSLANLLEGGITAVSPNTAMKFSAVWACVWLLSSSVGKLPLITYRRVDAGKERATDHPLYRMLRGRWNTEMSAGVGKRLMMTHLLLWGCAYAEIIRDGRGRIVGLQPIEPWRVTLRRLDGELVYDVQTDGRKTTLLKYEIIHLVGMTLDGVTGMSVISHAAATIRAGLSADKLSDSMMKNGLRTSGVLSHPGKLGTEGIANLRVSFTDTYVGPERAGTPIILEEGMTWSPNAIPPADAQFIEQSYLRVEDICRWFNVPPHKIKHLLRATNNNIEQQSLDYLSDSVEPYLELIGEEFNYKLFDQENEPDVYCEFLTQKLVQMDATARGNFYHKLFSMGVMTPNQIARAENLNDLPDGRGNVNYVPSNMMPAPTVEEAAQLLKAYIAKGASTGGKPQPETDGKVGGDSSTA